jgi:hypothetical protein
MTSDKRFVKAWVESYKADRGVGGVQLAFP